MTAANRFKWGSVFKAISTVRYHHRDIELSESQNHPYFLELNSKIHAIDDDQSSVITI